ncbi:MAG: high-potential iron-sulfur protein [Proteobacteria bacterium]|nr:high-potential iron-sulfur protein [Pseudomonadota bacterium]
MHRTGPLSRRHLLQQLLVGVPLAAAVTTAAAADAPLLAADSPEARQLGYVEDAKAATGAAPGNHCGDCALYQGSAGSTQGPCQLFAGKQVKAAGWCRSWAPQM